MRSLLLLTDHNESEGILRLLSDSVERSQCPNRYLNIMDSGPARKLGQACAHREPIVRRQPWSSQQSQTIEFNIDHVSLKLLARMALLKHVLYHADKAK